MFLNCSFVGNESIFETLTPQWIKVNLPNLLLILEYAIVIGKLTLHFSLMASLISEFISYHASTIIINITKRSIHRLSRRVSNFQSETFMVKLLPLVWITGRATALSLPPPPCFRCEFHALFQALATAPEEASSNCVSYFINMNKI